MLTLCERRTLSKNLTLSYNNVIYQIKTKRAAYTMRQAHVEVRETSTRERSPSNTRGGRWSTRSIANKNSIRQR